MVGELLKIESFIVYFSCVPANAWGEAPFG